jgi:hypothetical protein
MVTSINRLETPRSGLGETGTLMKKMRATRARKGSYTMLNLPNNGYKVYEVQLYNEQVRAMAQRRKRHSFFDRQWARAQVRDVVARDESEAWALITERFPPEDGFVVERITTSTF